ncbi:MAG: hypothetical protein HS111_40525 [Kofleriaceae bacterium]|nr:hypothetical protein [Kofleriaceae bacterium]MCL4228342.1 hypothetical protein [Myxococcales bacterium]
MKPDESTTSPAAWWVLRALCECEAPEEAAHAPTAADRLRLTLEAEAVATPDAARAPDARELRLLGAGRDGWRLYGYGGPSEVIRGAVAHLSALEVALAVRSLDGPGDPAPWRRVCRRLLDEGWIDDDLVELALTGAGVDGAARGWFLPLAPVVCARYQDALASEPTRRAHARRALGTWLREALARRQP